LLAASCVAGIYLWIAALTLQHNLSLYARDRHFDHLPQLRRIE